MPTLLEIRNDPNYINANAATKQAIFDKYSAGDKDYTSANEATRNAIQQRFGLSLAEEPEPVEEPGFGKMMGSAVKRGAMQTGSLLADVLPALAAKTVGADDYAKRQMEEAAATQQEIQEKYPARYPTLGDVKGPSDYLPFAAETAAEQIPNLATALIPGIGGGMLAARGLTGAAAATATRAGQLGGAYLGSFALNTPEVFQNIYEETGQMAPGASVIAGSVAGALDSIFPAYIMKQFTPGMKLGVIEKVLEKSGMKPGMIRAALAGGVTGVATEGPTEAGQEAISIMAEKFVGDNKDIWGSKEFNRLVESGVRGAVAGGGISGVTGGVSGIGAKGREEAREKERKDALEKIDALQNEIQTSHDQEAEQDPELYRKSTGRGVVLGGVEAQEGITPEQQHYFDQQHIDILQKALASGELLSTEEINKLNIIKRREDEYYATQATPDIASATEEVIPKPLEVVEGQEQRRPEFALQPSNVPQQTIPQGTEQGAPPIVNKAQGDLFEDQQGLTSFEQGYTPPQSIYTPPQTPAPGPIQVPGQETPTELTPEQQKFFDEKRGQSGVEEQQQQKLARLQELHNDRQRGVLPSQQDLQDFKALTAELPEFKPAFVIDPSTTANLGINKNAVIVKGENSIIGEDISDPVAAKRVAAKLQKHAINPRVAPEVKSNITEFLKRPEFQGAPDGQTSSDKASAKPIVGPTDGGVPVSKEPIVPTTPSVKATNVPRVVSGAGPAKVSNVGKGTDSSTLTTPKPAPKPAPKAELEAKSEAIQEQAEAELEAELEAESEAIQEQAEAEVDAGPIGQAIAKIEDGDLETKAQVRSFVNKLEKNGVLDDVEDVREGLSDREQSADDVLSEVSGLLDEARDNAVQELVDERQREADDKREAPATPVTKVPQGAATKPKPAPKELLTEDEQYERNERIAAAKDRTVSRAKEVEGSRAEKYRTAKQEIKDAEGNDNLLLRNAPEGTQGILVAAVKKAVDAISAKWANAPDISVVQSVSDLPTNIQEQINRDKANPKGIFDSKTDTVYLIADNITDARDAAITVSHEALGHYGLRSVLGGDYTKVMSRIYDQNPTVQRAANAKIKQGLDKATAVEEVLADMQGDRAVQSVWQQLKNIVRQFLQRIGVTSPTDKEVNELLGRAKDFVVKGGQKAAGETGAKTAYSQKDLDEEIPYDEKPEVNMEMPKSNKSMEDRIFDTPNMPEGIKSALFNTVVNVKDWATRTGYALAFGRDLADMIGNIIPSAKDYFKMMEAKEAVRTHYEGEIDAITSRAYQVKDLDELQSFLQESTTSQKWGFVPEWTGAAVVDPDMEAKFNELTPEAQQVAKDIFKHGSESRKEMQRLVTEDTEAAFKQELEGASKKEAVEINARRANIINMYSGGELQGPYAPLARFGNFVTIAKSKEYVEHERNASLKDYEWIRNHRGDPEHYIVEFSDSLGTATYRAKSMEKELNEKHPNAGWSTEASARQTQAKGVTEAPWSAFRRLKTMINAEESMGGKYALDPKDASKARKHIDQLLTDLYLTTLAETSARKHDLKRENVAGASKDMIRAFVSKGRADAHFIAALKSNGEITDVIQKMRDESKKDEGGSRAAKIRALNEILIRHSLGMQYIETPIQDKLMQFNSIWTLLTKPAYYFQNLTQPWMMSVPVMGRHEGVGEMKAVKALMEAYGQLAPAFGKEGFLKGFTSGKFDIDSLPITREEKDMLKRLKDQGILDVGISRDLGYWESRGGMTGPIVEAMHKMNTWVRQVETINRVTTALASYRLVGGGPKGEIEASHVINTTHGNYSATNAPRLWSMVPKGAGNLILQFRKFQFIQASLIIRLATTSMIGKDAKQKAAGRRALAWTLAHYGVMTGVQGLPAMAVIGYLAAAALGEDDEPVNAERWFTENVAGGDKEIAKLLWHGAPSLVGLDLTGMLGAQNMLSILPFTDVNLAERGGYEAAVLGLMGSFIGGTVNNGADGVNLMMKGDYYKGLEKMLPSGFSKAAQSYRLSSEGYTNSKGDLLMDPEEFTGLIVLAQALGLRTGKVADIQKRTGQVIEFDRYYKSRTSEITHRYTKAAKDGDSEEMYRLRDEFRALQDSKRRNGIKPQPITNLTQAVKEQRKRERGTIEGVQTTKATRRFVTEGAED